MFTLTLLQVVRLPKITLNDSHTKTNIVNSNSKRFHFPRRYLESEINLNYFFSI